MKPKRSLSWISLACGLVALISPLRAADNPEAVLFKDGQVWALEGNKAVFLTNDVQMPKAITVSTNGTFKVGAHSPRSLAEGQILGADGMLLSPNGRIEPVIDHIALDAGKTISSVNGERAALNQDVQLGKDKRLTPDHALLGSDGSWMRVIDGQLFTPDGKTIPGVDSVSLQTGKVVVQKEGTQLTVEPGRSIMMNDGTKVFGDGTVVGRDGQTTQLSEGQIITLEGVVKLR
jgi:hypothetical protein